MKTLFRGRKGWGGVWAFKKGMRSQTLSDFRKDVYWEAFKRGRAFIGGFTVLIISFVRLTLIRVGFLGVCFAVGGHPLSKTC